MCSSDLPELSKIKLTKSQKINFTVWPRPKDDFDFDKPEAPFSVLFKYITKDDSLPSNLKIANVENIVNITETLSEKSLKPETEKDTYSQYADLAPKRGGFIWPGNFSFNFKNIIK